MELLKPVVKSLGWKLQKAADACRVSPCAKKGLKRLQLCTNHTEIYRCEQHRLAMKRLNAARSLERAARRVTKQAKKVQGAARGVKKSG
jgi:hypothetical protein